MFLCTIAFPGDVCRTLAGVSLLSGQVPIQLTHPWSAGLAMSLGLRQICL